MRCYRENVIMAAKVRSVPPEREIISIIPKNLLWDGFTGPRPSRHDWGSPRTIRTTDYRSLRPSSTTFVVVWRRLDLNITELVVQPRLVAEVALTPDEREFGTITVIAGGGQTSASIIYDNQLKYSFVDWVRRWRLVTRISP